MAKQHPLQSSKNKPLYLEFKDFAQRGNVVDLAVGFILGGAFTTIVQSLVNDVIMPPIGLALAGVDFTGLYFTLDGSSHASLSAAQAAGAPTINYGLFINNVIVFFIVAMVLFFVVKGMNALKREEAKTPPPPEAKSRQELLLEDIRDLLAGKQQTS